MSVIKNRTATERHHLTDVENTYILGSISFLGRLDALCVELLNSVRAIFFPCMITGLVPSVQRNVSLREHHRSLDVDMFKSYEYIVMLLV